MSEILDVRPDLDRLCELARAEVAVEEIDGVPMAARKLHDVTPTLHEPTAMGVHTLTGLVGYLQADRDKLQPTEVVVHVLGPREVRVVSGIVGKRNQRFVYARAVIEDPLSGFFGRFRPSDEFTIALMTLFQEGYDRETVVKLAGNVSAENVARVQDDGFTQEITVRGGVALVGKEAVPNPVTLAAYRTFREVEQPPSPFLLRFQGGKESPVSCGLFEADGGTWQLEAIKNIVGWLKDELASEFEVIG